VQTLQAERARGQGPFTEGLDNPWALQIRPMQDAVAVWLTRLHATHPKTYPPWLQITNPKGLTHPAKRLWLLAQLMALSDALYALGTAPTDAQFQAAVCQHVLLCRQGFLQVRQTLAASEAPHWEWVYAALYWWPNYFRFMAHRADWQALAEKDPQDWYLDPTHKWPANAPKPAPKLPPPYPRWVYRLHLEHYGPKIMVLAGKPEKWPASPLQATHHQRVEPNYRPKAPQLTDPHQLGLNLGISPHR
jgi:hypothetical protein